MNREQFATFDVFKPQVAKNLNMVPAAKALQIFNRRTKKRNNNLRSMDYSNDLAHLMKS